MGTDLIGVPPLLARLAAVLGARPAQVESPPRPGQRVAGVLVLFFERGNILHLLLFKRTDLVSTHKGQVGFPGGSHEPGDADLLSTALREAQEEMGIDPGRVAVLGALKRLDTRVNNFTVSPYCGYLLDPDPVFVPHSYEVAGILELPVAELRQRRARRHGLVPGFARMVPIPLPYYRVGETVVWGVSGMVLDDLLRALDEAESSPV